MRYGFAIDNTRCIGCHACSTACKSENEVPLGVYRTWVKYVETGAYPNTRRHFQVTRCNHCENPPCVRICPVQAMYQRADGIVEFDKDICIGCKACLQACPYDAIHIDPESGTAAKCHYCSHRTDLGLEPACVVVCPTQAIVSGDLDEPEGDLAKLLARKKATVRKPEQGTAPKLFYIDGSSASLHPTASERTPETFMWADVVDPHGHGPAGDAAAGHGGGGNGSLPALAGASAGGGASYVSYKQAHSGVTIRVPKPQGVPQNPIPQDPQLAAAGAAAGGAASAALATQAGQMVQVAYNAQHKIPWHWPVPAYLVTKAIGAGVFLLLAIYALLFKAPLAGKTAIAGGLLSLAMLGATTALLVYDLEKPLRFLSILFRPQLKSWLTRGAFILIGFSGVAGLWWGAETLAALGVLSPQLVDSVRTPLLIAGIPLAIGAAIYTGFLFAQAEGRDLWQSPLLPLHLLVQALMMGGAGLLLLGVVVALPVELLALARITLAATLVVDLFVLLFGELGVPHASEVAARAAKMITKGRYAMTYWIGSIALGHGVPLALLGLDNGAAHAAAVAAVIGLYAYEHAFVMAPQEVPNS